MPRLEALATAVPRTRVEQQEVREALAGMFHDHPGLHRILESFDRSGIAARYFAMEPEWYLEPQGWQSRSEAYGTEALRLAEEASRKVLAKASVPPEGVDAVVAVSTTGVMTPSLDARLQNVLGLRPDATRLPVWGLGCAGGVAGLNRAADLARANPEARVLLVAVELCTLNFRIEARSKKHLIANALFADGAAAALVTGDALAAKGPRIHRGGSHAWPHTEHLMGWEVMEDGLDVVFDASIPEVVRTGLGEVTRRYLKQRGVAAPDRHVPHPGGAKILDAYAEALAIADPTALEASRAILREYGNMSSPTVLFVLERALERPLAPGETALLTAMGPGFAAELGLLEGTA